MKRIFQVLVLKMSLKNLLFWRRKDSMPTVREKTVYYFGRND